LIENAFKCAQPRFELTSVTISHFLCVFSTRNYWKQRKYKISDKLVRCVLCCCANVMLFQILNDTRPLRCQTSWLVSLSIFTT